MVSFNIAMLQMFSYGSNIKENLKKGDAYCRKAKEQSADLVLFPEMWSIGYSLPFEGADDKPFLKGKDKERAAWKEKSVSRNSEFIIHFKKLAKELDMAIGITYLESYEPMPRNSIALIDRHGNMVFNYSKVHTCDFSMETLCTPGEEFFVGSLNTIHGNIEIGAMICYDREFPESARLLMLKGAEIIIVPNACDMNIHRLSQLRTRAYENMVGVAMCNYPGKNCGHSAAYDGVCFNSQGAVDNLIVEAGENEGIYMAGFDMDKLRNYRERESWGNSYRKPKSYTLITSEEVTYPFVRNDSRR